jgi:thiosulfate/3-mercaptopyruvate sulfurtransferase
MKRTACRSALFLAIASVLIPASIMAKGISAIVSVDWLERNLSNPKLIVMDVRKVEEYREGHIPGAINAYYGTWVTGKGYHTEVPREDDLFEAMGGIGIRGDSIVVVVGRMDVCQAQVECARVACTLHYGGFDNVAMLDGGYEQWVREGKPVSTDIVKPKKTVYKGELRKELLADREYVLSHLGKAVFVDVREPELYLGKTKQVYEARAGHIPGAVNLPVSEAFTRSGTFKNRGELETIAARAVGSDKSKQIVTYCDAGKCCPTWAFILRDVLGYKNVRAYVGSFEEWSNEPGLPVSR